MIRIGSRVEWHRSGAPFGGYMCGYVTALFDFHASVRSNGRVYKVQLSKLKDIS